MYTLTLTRGERLAIDFVGGRYDHGDDLQRMLNSVHCEQAVTHNWDDDVDFVYEFEEFEAWEFRDAYHESRFDLFADSFRRKLYAFMDAIV